MGVRHGARRTRRPIWCSRGSTAAPTWLKMSPTRAPSRGLSRARSSASAPSRSRRRTGSIAAGTIKVGDGAGARAGAVAQAAGAGVGAAVEHHQRQFPGSRARQGGGHWSPRRAGATRACSTIDERHDTWGNPTTGWPSSGGAPRAGGHRSRHRLCRLHLGDAAVPRPHPPRHARER